MPHGVALWLTHLGGSSEQTAPMLTRVADRGLLAVSFDPPGHGRRSAGGEPGELAREVLGLSLANGSVILTYIPSYRD